MIESMKKLRTILDNAPEGPAKILVDKDELAAILAVAESVETGDLRKAMVQFSDIVMHYQQRLQRQVEAINRLLAAGR